METISRLCLVLVQQTNKEMVKKVLFVNFEYWNQTDRLERILKPSEVKALNKIKKKLGGKECEVKRVRNHSGIQH